MMIRVFSILAVLILAGVGCGDDKDKNEKTNKTQTTAPTANTGGTTGTQPPKTAPAASSPEARARQVFDMRCAMCHGPNGTGDGPAAANINPKPRNYTSEKWQESVTDEQIAEVIKKGGGPLGLNPMMPAQPDLSDDDIKGLVALIRSFGE